MMTREDKIKQLALIEEKRRRLIHTRPNYRPRPGQLKVLQSPAKNIFMFSGNGAGKSTLLVNLMMFLARGHNPWSGETFKVPAKIIYVAPSARFIDQRIIPELRKWYEIPDAWLKRLGRPNTAQIQFDNGSIVDFVSADADFSTSEGTEASAVLVDEPIPRPLYIALKRSLRMKGHKNTFFFAGTPISERWIRHEIYEPWAKGLLPDTECFRVHSNDNEANLSKGYIEEFSRTLTEDERATRLEGAFFDTNALALAGIFKPEHHVIPFDTFKYTPDMPCVVAIDNHSVKPHHAVMITCDKDDRLIVIKEMAMRGNATEFSVVLKEWERGYSIADRVCDSLGNMEMTSGEGMHPFIEGLQRNGVAVRGTTFKEKSHEDLIDRLKQGLALPPLPDNDGSFIPKIRILSSCTGLISDIESATWQKNRMTGEMVAKLDTSTKDHLSCMGYGLALHLFYDISKHESPVYRETRPNPTVRAGSDRREEILRARRRRWFNHTTKGKNYS